MVKNNYFEKFNKKMEEKLGIDAVTHGTTDFSSVDSLKKYEEYIKTQKLFQVQFDSCGRDGTFVGTIDGDVLVVMRGKSTLEHMPYFVARMSSKLIGYTFDVRAIEVDREKRRVYVESARDINHNSTRAELVRQLQRAIENGETPRVWGKVNNIVNNRAYIDIFGEKVLGVINAPYWQKGYLRFLSTVCSVGEYYPFEVVGVRPAKNNKGVYFVLSRVNVADDPWENIPMDVLKAGAIIYVKCVERPQGIAHWWGNSVLAPNIEILGLFPAKEGERLQIIPGVSYKCKIRQIARASEDKMGRNTFVVIPFAVAEEDMKEYTRLQQIKAMRINLDEQNEALQDSEQEEA